MRLGSATEVARTRTSGDRAGASVFLNVRHVEVSASRMKLCTQLNPHQVLLDPLSVSQDSKRRTEGLWVFSLFR
jgi:hypothetical protein